MTGLAKAGIRAGGPGPDPVSTAYRAGLAALLCVGLAPPGAAQTRPEIQAGRDLAATHCARCHSIETTGPSPLSGAPPFRDLHRRYPVESLEEALAEGIMTGHPDMPQFRFSPQEIRNMIVFLKSLE